LGGNESGEMQLKLYCVHDLDRCDLDLGFFPLCLSFDAEEGCICFCLSFGSQRGSRRVLADLLHEKCGCCRCASWGVNSVGECYCVLSSGVFSAWYAESG
jgi:hypothetical protein